jgi:Flp pilus assembly protein TadB
MHEETGDELRAMQKVKRVQWAREHPVQCFFKNLGTLVVVVPALVLIVIAICAAIFGLAWAWVNYPAWLFGIVVPVGLITFAVFMTKDDQSY